MKKFARIENGVVMEILTAVSLPEFHPSLTWVEAPDEVSEGWQYDDGVFTEPAQPDDVVPKSVTMRQARLALLQAGLLDDVDVAIAALPSPQKDQAQIEWEYSQEVFRDKELVQILAPSLGLDDAALDQLFITAAAL